MACELADEQSRIAVAEGKECSCNLAGLLRSNAVTQHQAETIRRKWGTLDADTFADPSLRGVPEHTRAYLERESQR